MKPSITTGMRSRGLVIGSHLCLWFLLYLGIRGLGGTTPDLREAEGFSGSPQSPAPVAKIEHLFTSDIWPKNVISTNSPTPFQTAYFIPQAAPTPPPPTTRKIELTYQGFYQTGTNTANVMVKMGDAFLVAGVGGKLTANLFAAQASVASLLLTNAGGQTNLLLLNTKKEIEVPLP
jgi:hypothetical protein